MKPPMAHLLIKHRQCLNSEERLKEPVDMPFLYNSQSSSEKAEEESKFIGFDLQQEADNDNLGLV